GYPPALLSELAGAKLAERLNVGVIGLRSDAIDWERLETWCRTLLARHGSHYLLEQGLTAMLLAGQPCAVAPAVDYVALPSADEVIVVVDGSADGTLAVARSFEAAGVRVIHQLNAGASAARNRAYAACSGEYVQNLDADDLLAPDKIERQMKRLLDGGPEFV